MHNTKMHTQVHANTWDITNGNYALSVYGANSATDARYGYSGNSDDADDADEEDDADAAASNTDADNAEPDDNGEHTEHTLLIIILRKCGSDDNAAHHHHIGVETTGGAYANYPHGNCDDDAYASDGSEEDD